MPTSIAVRFLSNAETALLLGIKPETLEIWRIRARGPRYRKLGTSKQSPVRYAEADVIAWIDANAFQSTSEQQHAQQRKSARR